MRLAVGTRLGPYEIQSPIGSGGMGEVYKARDVRLDRTVAIKVLLEAAARDPDRRRRFEQEARAVAALNHPHICTLYDVGCAVASEAATPSLEAIPSETPSPSEPIHFLVMEFLEGRTLRQELELARQAGGSAGPEIAVKKALEYAEQIADALAAAHRRGIVHRDLKPGNIMLTGSGVKLLDFGLAKLADVAAAFETVSALTASHLIVGTVPYMSPEQAAGRAADARSDLFSLGTILYEMLSGRRPFERDSAVGTLAAILQDAAAAIPGMTPEVARLVERCLHKDPAQRFQSAGDLKSAIEACLAPQPGSARPSVAVLPFTNMSGTKEDDYLCEGLAEEIINALTRIAGLRVVARTSAFQVARMGLDVREAGARLGVGSMLEGSVRRAGNRVRVTAQLVSATDGTHVWSERYDRELTDVLALEDDIATAIANQLRVEFERDHPGRVRPPVDAEAHEAYLEGRYYFARGTPEALVQAKGCYERAIARDPNSALAYDSLAELYWFLGFFGGVPPCDAFSLGTWHALRALELDGTLAQTHALLGMLRKELDYNWPEVDRELASARELNPESPLVRLRYAISGLMPHGHVHAAIVEMEHVVRADPLSLFARWWLAIMLYFARLPDRVIDEGRHMIALDSAQFLGHWVLGIGLMERGATDEGLSSLRHAHELSGGTPFTMGFLAWASGCAGCADDTRRLLRSADDLARTRYVPASTFALGYIGLDEWDTAFEWLDKAVETRDPLVMPIKTYPFLDPVRTDARYHALLRKMKLE